MSRITDLNPKSPFSKRRLSQLRGDYTYEGNAWAAQLAGWFEIEYIGKDWYQGRCFHYGGRRSKLQNPPRYHADWDAAFALVELPQWPKSLEYFFSIAACDEDEEATFGVTECFDDSIGQLVSSDKFSYAVRDAFIIAAVNDVVRKGSVA